MLTKFFLYFFSQAKSFWKAAPSKFIDPTKKKAKTISVCPEMLETLMAILPTYVGVSLRLTPREKELLQTVQLIFNSNFCSV